MIQKLENYFKNFFTKQMIVSFISCFIGGYIIHIFVFTNTIPNSDGLSRIYDFQQMTISGRWFLHYASIFNMYTQLPAVIGFFSILFMALSSSLVTSILDIKNKYIAALIGILMISIPINAYTFLYLFTAAAYSFGILLSVLSVWILKNHKKGFWFASLILACSIGTYQSYFSIAVSLCFILIFTMTISSKTNTKEIITKSIKYFLFLLSSLVLYSIILKAFLYVKDLELLEYRNINSTFNFKLNNISYLIPPIYENFRKFFFEISSICIYNNKALIIFNFGLFILMVISIFIIIKKNKFYKSIIKLNLVFLLLLLSPLIFNLSYFLKTDTPLTQYSLVFVYVFILMLIDKLIDKTKYKYLFYSSSIITTIIIIVFFNINNTIYLSSQHAHRSSQLFITNLVSRVESLENYTNGMDVVIIGQYPNKFYYSSVQPYKDIEYYGSLSTSILPLNKHIYYYLNDWYNIQWQEPEEKELIRISNSKEFLDMPLYPSDGSIKIIDNKVVVKLSYRYIPKRKYEIQYKNRK